MNDDELGQRLHDEIHARVRPPEYAPERLHEHMRNLNSMASIREPLSNQTHTLRNLFAFGAAIVVVALLGSGLLAWQTVRTGSKSPAVAPEMFGRVDAKVAWAESGNDLYLTKDGGVTWSHSTLPGGLSVGQYEQAMSAQTPSDATPTPILAPTGPLSSDSAGDQAGAPASFPNHLYPVFIDADHGWLLSWAESGDATAQTVKWTLTAHRTTDGGQTWQSSQLPGTYDGYGLIQFVDPEHGWIEVYPLNTRPAQSPSTPADGSASASPATTDTPAADTTTLLATSDGGASWSMVSTLSSQAFISFTSATEGWGYGQDPTTGGVTTFLRTTDGGRTWSQSDFPSQQGCLISGAPDAPTRSSGSVVVRALCMPNGTNQSTSEEIVTLVSADDGQSWTVDSTQTVAGSPIMSGAAAVLNLPSGQPIASYEYASYQYPTSASTSGGFHLQATFDGGKTWTTYPTDGLPASIVMAEWASPDDVWVLASGNGSPGHPAGHQLYSSRDAGKTWTALLGAPAWPASFQPLPTPVAVAVPTAVAVNPIQSGPMITSLGRVDAKVAWVVSSDASSNGNTESLRITQDGGATWSEPRTLPAYGDVQFVDANHGWVVEPAFAGTAQSPGQIVVLGTEDGGVTWQKGAVDLGGNLANSGNSMGSTTLHFRDALNGVLLAALVPTGADGNPLPSPSGAICEKSATSDGGTTWSAPSATACMMSVNYVNASLGYAADASMSPTLYVTEDGGQTWTSGNLPTPAGAGSNGVSVDLLERRADGTLRAAVSWLGGTEPMVSLVSSDGGRTWSISGNVSLATNSYQLVALSEGHWLALSNGWNFPSTTGVASGLVTEDAGVTWQPIAVAGLPPMFTSLNFVSATDGWAAAGTPVCGSSVAVPSSGSGEGAKSACAVGPQSVYATTDGGATWKVLFAP